MGAEWHGVAISLINPDICLKVDSALAHCGCKEPSKKLRQFLYLYHESLDFDYETLTLLVRIFNATGDDNDIWNNLVSLEFQRDCGMSRDDYLAELTLIAEGLETDTKPMQNLLTA